MGYAPLELNGKVAVVIGGTSGIGRAIAHGLAEAGADVVTAPLLPDERIAAVLLDRYDAALAAAGRP